MDIYLSSAHRGADEGSGRRGQTLICGYKAYSLTWIVVSSWLPCRNIWGDCVLQSPTCKIVILHAAAIRSLTARHPAFSTRADGVRRWLELCCLMAWICALSWDGRMGSCSSSSKC